MNILQCVKKQHAAMRQAVTLKMVPYMHTKYRLLTPGSHPLIRAIAVS